MTINHVKARVSSYMQGLIETRLLTSELLGECIVLRYKLAAEIEASQMHLVTTTYGDGAMEARKAEYWTMVLTMVRIIWRYLRKVRVESDMAYGSDKPLMMVSKYLCGALQVHRLMHDFLQTQFLHHPEVDPYITIYLFKHRDPRVEVYNLKQRVEAKEKP